MRSTWLATVYQLDWPKSRISTTGNQQEINIQKKLMTRILDSLVSANMNAVCFQIRSRCDAMYKSSYEPWSSDLVATRGMDPGYDPLAFVIEEGHKRGLEVHAWVNPYRFESVAGQWSGLPGDYNTDHPDWVLTHGSAAILNPGLPEVRQRITDIIKEVVTNYDVDGVLFDDYFYLSGTTEDSDTYSKYNPEGLALADWRRANVNKMIAQVYNMIQGLKPYVAFGVSPAGIWDVSPTIAASYGLTLPSGISGGYAYNGIYCDPVAWLQQGTVDYISPQIYWTTGSGTTDYNILSPWWSDVALHFGKHFYSSHSISALTASATKTTLQINGATLPATGFSTMEQSILYENSAPQTRFVSSEVGLQIDANRNADKNDAPGSIFYSATKLYSTTGFIDYLKRNKFTYKALAPAIHWKKTSNPGVVSNISLNGSTLSWTPVDGNIRYSIYAIPDSEVNDPSIFNSSEYLIGISYGPSYTLNGSVDFSGKRFAVAVLDRYGNEYAPVIMGQSAGITPPTMLVFPADQANVLAPFTFTWETAPAAISYILEIATDANFENMLCAREVYTNSFSTNMLKPLTEGQTYYWRVKVKATGSESVASSVRTFVPTIFSISKPVDKSTNISLTPEISWTDAGEGATYQLEIASAMSFKDDLILYSASYGSSSCKLPAELLIGLKAYYLRVKTMINGVETYSPIVNFTTEAVVPDMPQILFPLTGSIVENSQLKVLWNKEPRAKNFRVELCPSESFAPRQTKAKQVDPFVYETLYDGLSSGIYYLRARAEYFQKDEFGSILTNYTNWSDTIRVDYKLSTGIANNFEGNRFYILASESGNKQLILNVTDYSKISVRLNSISGVPLAHLLNDTMSSGKHVLDIPLEHLPSGIYLLVVDVDGNREVLKIFK